MNSPDQASFSPPGPLLKSIAPTILDDLIDQLQRLGYQETAMELENVVIPLQSLGGSVLSFSFMAYALPRLTFEERNLISLREPIEIPLLCSNGHIRIALDDFGRINWFFFEGLPDLYSLVVDGIKSFSGNI